MEVENEVQFTHVAEVSVKHLHKVMHKLQRDQLIVTAVNAHDEIQTRIALVDYLSCRSHLCSDILAAVGNTKPFDIDRQRIQVLRATQVSAHKRQVRVGADSLHLQAYIRRQRILLKWIASACAADIRMSNHLDIFPVQKVTQLQGPAQDHGGHISDDLHYQNVCWPSLGINVCCHNAFLLTLCSLSCQVQNTFARSFCVYVEYHLERRTLPCLLRSRTNCTA